MKNQALISAILLVLLQKAVAVTKDDEDICGKVDCGRGVCIPANTNMAGFVCKCSIGWTQLHFSNEFLFLPCNIPACDFRFSCYNDSLDHFMPTFPESTIFDPCFWSYCGGGMCKRDSSFGYACKCRKGFGNLLNISSFPCIKDCALGANCNNLGISVTNPTPSFPKADANHAVGTIFTRRVMWVLLVLVTGML